MLSFSTQPAVSQVNKSILEFYNDENLLSSTNLSILDFPLDGIVNLREEVGGTLNPYDMGVKWLSAKGLGVGRFKTAYEYFSKSFTDIDRVDAQAKLGLMKVLGVGTAKDIKGGLRHLAQSAHKGNLVATYCLATLFRNGIPGYLEKDIKKTIFLMDEAARAGYTPALCFKGFMAEKAEDSKLARKYFARAAQQGSITGLYKTAVDMLRFPDVYGQDSLYQADKMAISANIRMTEMGKKPLLPFDTFIKLGSLSIAPNKTAVDTLDFLGAYSEDAVYQVASTKVSGKRRAEEMEEKPKPSFSAFVKKASLRFSLPLS